MWTGYYEFTGLLPGAYSVCEELQSGWTNTTPVCQTVNLTPGDVDHFIDFGNIRYATMKVDKITLPTGDSQSFNMYIKQGDASVEEFALADTDPVHVNSTLVPGTYSLTEAVPNGWMNDSWNCTVNGQPVASNLAITIGGGETAECSFTNVKFGSIEGSKFRDVDANGVWDGSDTRIGWSFVLKQNDSIIQSITTTGNEKYLFSNLAPDIYQVCEVEQQGWEQTFPSTVSKCHDAVVVNPGQVTDDIDF